MPLDVQIQDGGGSSRKAHVSSSGELIVNKVDYSSAYSLTADVINTGYNFVPPQFNKRFVVTDILLYANKNVGVNDATVVLYEADSATSTTSTKTILNIEMQKNSSRDITGLNLIISEGKWVNIKTDDDDIFATLMGFYVDV